MNGKSDIDIDAILGDEPGSDPDFRAQLVARLSVALESRNPLPPADVMQIAAYLDQGMTEDEKLDLYNRLSGSAANYADLESAIDLLETVQNSPQRPSAAVMALAREILKPDSRQGSDWRRVADNRLSESAARYAASANDLPAVAGSGGGGESPTPEPEKHKSVWRWLPPPRARLAVGFAIAATVGLLIWNQTTETPLTSSVSEQQANASGGADDSSRQALLGNTLSAVGNGIPASPSPASSLWGAVAVSKSGNIYGVAQNVSTRETAMESALANCAAQHRTDCTVMASGQGQCFAVAGAIVGTPAVASAVSIADAQRLALATCNSARKELLPCITLTSFCSKK